VTVLGPLIYYIRPDHVKKKPNGNASTLGGFNMEPSGYVLKNDDATPKKTPKTMQTQKPAVPFCSLVVHCKQPRPHKETKQ
jgi:hypothetical protein